MNYINIKGGKELILALRGFPVKIERQVMQVALLDGAKVIAKEVRKNVPKDSGDLKRSIKVLRGKDKKQKGQVAARVRAGDKKAFYAHMIEYGTAAHVIKGKKGNNLIFTASDGKSVNIRSVNHPGISAHPFMRPAIDTKEKEAVRAVGNRIGEFLRTNNVTPSVDFEVE